MKFSHDWLSQYVTIRETPEQVGGRLTGAGIPVDAIEPAAEVYVDCPMLGWERVALEPDDEQQIRHSGFFPVPEDAEPGRYQVLVVVRDLAGNRFEQTVSIFIQPGGVPCDEC